MYKYKGFMLDSARHMQPIDEIKKLIDAISELGFNKFHWHLTDDQGWRFECEKYPMLNTDAAERPYSDFGKVYDNKPYGRVYTKEEMLCKRIMCPPFPIRRLESDAKQTYMVSMFRAN